MAKAGSLKCDFECGEGDVFLSRDFLERNSLFRMDVLQDWIGDLQKAYDQAYSEWTVEYKNISSASKQKDAPVEAQE